VDLRFLIFSDC